MSPARILPTQARDIAALQHIERAASELFRGSGLIPFPAEGPGANSAAFHEAAIDAELSWTAFVDEKPVGFVLGIAHPDWAYLAELSVDPAFGRRGIGAALVMHFCAEMKARGERQAALSTFRDVPWNAPFYAKLGFAEWPRARYTDWMRLYEANQVRGGLDISKRLFMRRAL